MLGHTITTNLICFGIWAPEWDKNNAVLQTLVEIDTQEGPKCAEDSDCIFNLTNKSIQLRCLDYVISLCYLMLENALRRHYSMNKFKNEIKLKSYRQKLSCLSTTFTT